MAAPRRARSGFDPLEEVGGTLRVPAAERSYDRQFAQIYDYRLAVLRRRVLASATEAFGDTPPYIERILDIPPKQLCFVIGTVYAAMPLKPDVLQEIAREESIAPQPVVSTYVDMARDELYLEDQSGRVRLVGDKIKPGSTLACQCVTGAVVGVFGAETPDGDLEVADLAFAGPAAPLQLEDRSETPACIVLASGLRMGGADAAHDMHYDLLLEWLSGELGTADERAETARISSLVLAGNSVERQSWAPPDVSVSSGRQPKPPPTTPFAELDPMLAQLCETLDAVVLLPGAQDPSSTTLPQQPLHRGLLPRASAWPNLHCTTNPAWCALHGKAILATAGQTIDDLVKYLPATLEGPYSRAMAMALATLQWSHMAPTAPDTLCTPPN